MSTDWAAGGGVEGAASATVVGGALPSSREPATPLVMLMGLMSWGREVRQAVGDIG